ncbi:MAG: hypothetical protein V7L00_22285 [Nostoc sp.]|uniref:hypothetical protein n=1 Tax=Nostoc sp. TaxID=1180 RepID=UPI002FF8D8F4
MRQLQQRSHNQTSRWDDLPLNTVEQLPKLFGTVFSKIQITRIGDRPAAFLD